MKLLFFAICSVFVILTAIAEKTIPQLIEDLGVKESSSHTCNTAASLLVQKHEKAIPYLKKAISNPNKQIRSSAMRCLSNINSKESRKVLIDASSNTSGEMRSALAYYLAWHPNKDAEEIYIASLNDKTPHHRYRAINALGKIKSVKALEKLKNIIATTKSWRLYYTAFCAVREIENRSLKQKLFDALIFMRRAQYAHYPVNKEKLKKFAFIIRENMDSVLPDLLNACLAPVKGNRFHRDPDLVTLLNDAGEDAYPYIAIALNDLDNKWKAEALIKELGISKKSVKSGYYRDNWLYSLRYWILSLF